MKSTHKISRIPFVTTIVVTATGMVSCLDSGANSSSSETKNVKDLVAEAAAKDPAELVKAVVASNPTAVIEELLQHHKDLMLSKAGQEEDIIIRKIVGDQLTKGEERVLVGIAGSIRGMEALPSPDREEVEPSLLEFLQTTNVDIKSGEKRFVRVTEKELSYIKKLRAFHQP